MVNFNLNVINQLIVSLCRHTTEINTNYVKGSFEVLQIEKLLVALLITVTPIRHWRMRHFAQLQTKAKNQRRSKSRSQPNLRMFDTITLCIDQKIVWRQLECYGCNGKTY